MTRTSLIDALATVPMLIINPHSAAMKDEPVLLEYNRQLHQWLERYSEALTEARHEHRGRSNGR